MHCLKHITRNADLICHAGHIAACLALLLRENFVVEIDAYSAPEYFTLMLHPNAKDLEDSYTLLADAKQEVEALLVQFPASDNMQYEIGTYVAADIASLQIRISVLERVQYNGSCTAGKK